MILAAWAVGAARLWTLLYCDFKPERLVALQCGH
jgi:hypothetical protein